ncbi:MAG: hypothetical protein CSA22_04745 [Deltaproteobacteria bacterium]|nr:MAG: hypothetical protein CSA22_04745 [Deltaproteobacteria bacterium]
MVTQIYAIAVNTFRDAVRDRVLMVFSGAAVILLLFSTILGDMSVGGKERIIQNMGYAVFGLWGLFCIVYMGGNTIQRELHLKTVYMTLSRPVRRSTFMLGKLLGINLVLSALCLLLLLIIGVVYLSSGIKISSILLIAYGFIWGEWILLSAISLFFASFTTPLLHGFFLTAVYVLGHWARDLFTFARNTDSALLKNVLLTLYYGIPNLDSLSFRAAALYNETVSVGTYVAAAGILFLWTLFFTLCAIGIFQTRSIK